MWSRGVASHHRFHCKSNFGSIFKANVLTTDIFIKGIFGPFFNGYPSQVTPPLMTHPPTPSNKSFSDHPLFPGYLLFHKFTSNAFNMKTNY